MTVYAVVFSNYDPAEVAGLYETREDAEHEAARLNAKMDWEPWEVVEWPVEPPSVAMVATVVARPDSEPSPPSVS